MKPPCKSTRTRAFHVFGMKYPQILKKAICFALPLLLIFGAVLFAAPLKAYAGANWSSVSSGTSNNLNGVCYGNGVFIAVGDGGTILTSTTATSWTGRTSGTTAKFLGVSANGSGLVAAVGVNGTVAYSGNNGATWSITSVSATNTTGCIATATACSSRSLGTPVIPPPTGVHGRRRVPLSPTSTASRMAAQRSGR